MGRVSKIILTMLLMLGISTPIYASGLDGVIINQVSEPAPTEVIEEINEDEVTITKNHSEDMATAQAIGDMFKESGVDAESLITAQEYLRPAAEFINYTMAVVLVITSLLLMLITCLDLLYIAFPPVRDMLDGGSMGGQPAPTNQLRMQGMGAQSQMQGNQATSPGGGLSAFGRWISDEAMAASKEAQQMNGMQRPSLKPIILSYFKKRTFFMVVFGLCMILLPTTVFTDLGIKIGMFVIEMITKF